MGNVIVPYVCFDFQVQASHRSSSDPAETLLPMIVTLVLTAHFWEPCPNAVCPNFVERCQMLPLGANAAKKL